MKMVNAEGKFAFRSKFENCLESLNLSEEARSAVEKSFVEFFEFTEDKALFLLWKMPIDKDYASKALENVGLSFEIIPLEAVSTYRNELRYQYERFYPDFLNVEVSENIAEAYGELVRGSDKVQAKMIYTVLKNKLYSDATYISRILSLLSSEEENRFCGGIHELGFSWKETAYIKSEHLRVYSLFNAMFEEMWKREKLCKNKPFKDLEDKIKEAGIVLAEENSKKPKINPGKEKVTHKEQTEESVAVQEKEYTKLTAEAVVEHKELFAIFARESNYNILSEISKLGFNLNIVMGKIEAIKTLLDAIDAFNN